VKAACVHLTAGYMHGIFIFEKGYEQERRQRAQLR
jgi:hypothetical protein